MSAVEWSPLQYLRYQDERSRPFLELLNRVDCSSPDEVVDLGCGPGNATMMLRDRWPNAKVIGVDNSREMLAQAQPLALADKLEFQLDDVSTWSSDDLLDVIVSNAAFQWIPGHLARFKDFAEMLKPEGWFAFQVPNMAQEPSHVMLNELGTSSRWRDQLERFTHSMSVNTITEYIDTLQACGCAVDAWETTYMQVLPGDNAVLEWARGSSMRPFLTALGPEEATEFATAFGERVARAYPKNSHGTVYRFRRMFVVAQKR